MTGPGWFHSLKRGLAVSASLLLTADDQSVLFGSGNLLGGVSKVTSAGRYKKKILELQYCRCMDKQVAKGLPITYMYLSP